ncbi:MAG: PucR family transcriptional regulator ligand-binding domain-containing protein [Candidatus Metalachnospira sp.]|nr:PucR family transcriptional regulator ligand-binding domain-containing protein [Candidatus Metalachnospira sp.]
MALTLAELCRNSENDYGMMLIAGEKGIDNIVQWVHYIEGGEVPRFLHGYELVFTTGIAHQDTDWLIQFAKKLFEYGACGFVINLGPYVRNIPRELINYCNSVNFPLYTIPWETRIVDITYEFCHHIITDEKLSKGKAEMFIYAINNPQQESTYKSILEKSGFVDGETFLMAAVSLKVNNPERRESAERMTKYNIGRRLNVYTDRHSIFDMDKFILVVCQGMGQNDFETEIKSQAEILKNSFIKDGIYIGIAPYEKDSALLRKAYKRVCDVIKLAESFNSEFMRYSDTGIYKLLMAIDDKSNLRDYYNECLGALLEYDVKNGTDYISTLRCYLENESSIAEVAKLTYVHRNTVNYKIKKIKEILNCDLSQSDKLKLTLAFCIEKVL